MSLPRFKVGQLVNFNPARSTIPASIREYKILRILPHDGGERRYRIKTISEAFERIASERDLTHRAAL